MCAEEICREMKDPKNGLIWKEKEPATETYANRFMMDVDGHALTERFRRFLSSKSLVFKMTVIQVIALNSPTTISKFVKQLRPLGIAY